jgi:hypothetical protein
MEGRIRCLLECGVPELSYRNQENHEISIEIPSLGLEVETLRSGND